tara:strand:- start:5096 stop:5308 length:213 start_codon:yes stop_codon:yes gene_type:complete
MSDSIFFTPEELAVELWGQFTYKEKNTLYRYLRHDVFKPLEESSGFKILKDSNRYLIPGGLVKAIKEQAG